MESIYTQGWRPKGVSVGRDGGEHLYTGLAFLLPLQGVITVCVHTQGAALGYKLLPFQGVLLLEKLISFNFTIC